MLHIYCMSTLRCVAARLVAQIGRSGTQPRLIAFGRTIDLSSLGDIISPRFHLTRFGPSRPASLLCRAECITREVSSSFALGRRALPPYDSPAFRLLAHPIALRDLRGDP